MKTVPRLYPAILGLELLRSTKSETGVCGIDRVYGKPNHQLEGEQFWHVPVLASQMAGLVPPRATVVRSDSSGYPPSLIFLAVPCHRMPSSPVTLMRWG